MINQKLYTIQGVSRKNNNILWTDCTGNSDQKQFL